MLQTWKRTNTIVICRSKCKLITSLLRNSQLIQLSSRASIHEPVLYWLELNFDAVTDQRPSGLLTGDRPEPTFLLTASPLDHVFSDSRVGLPKQTGRLLRILDLIISLIVSILWVLVSRLGKRRDLGSEAQDKLSSGSISPSLPGCSDKSPS